MSPQFEIEKLGESTAEWRVFWVPRDAVRTGARKRVLERHAASFVEPQRRIGELLLALRDVGAQ